jgi:hypothetical protein
MSNSIERFLMPSLRVLRMFCVSILLALCCAPFARGAEPVESLGLEAPKGWRGERIKLPPPFAPEMKLEGVEEIRFSQGMFRPESNDFFSYVIVFRLDGRPKLSPETLQRELLAYYRGLAKAVGRGKVKTEGLSIAVEPDERFPAKNAQQYVATLKWIEPFSTGRPQTLRIEIRVWDDPENPRTWAFMCVSPNDPDDPIWKTMHEIRDRFLKSRGVPTGVDAP